MACPDDVTLDFWLAEALPFEEAAAVAAHVRTCPTCSGAQDAAAQIGAELHAALALDADEVAYLSRLDLASSWNPHPVAAAPAWTWIVFACAIGGFAAWLMATQLFGSAMSVAAQVGLGTLPVYSAVTALFSVGQALVDVIRSPALGLTQPLLAAFAVALLVWPSQLIPQRRTHA
jgi:hypothetical protein